MKAPITAAQAMQHPVVVETINTLSQLAEKLRVERDALLHRVEKVEKDACHDKGGVIVRIEGNDRCVDAAVLKEAK